MSIIKTFIYSFLLTGIIFFIGCDKKQEVRKYRETSPAHTGQTTVSKQTSAVPKTNPSKKLFSWVTPEGWQEVESNSKIRLATFTISGQEGVKGTIIPLEGEAGGLKANIQRWVLQISNSPDNIKKNTELLYNKKENITSEGDLKGYFVDFTEITANPKDPSILVTVFRVDTQTIFIKLTGSKKMLIDNTKAFKKLCLSFKRSGS